MQTKTSKVISVRHNTKSYPGKYGQMFIHLIEFENGDKGEYHSKSEVCEKFTSGQQADYTIEVKTTGNYTNTSIKPVEPQAGGFKKDNKDQGIITALSCISSACQLHQRVVHSTAEDVIKDAEKFYQFAMSKTSK
jgi:hypothetical protein